MWLHWLVSNVCIHIELRLLVVSILVKDQWVERVIISMHWSTCRALFVSLDLRCCWLIVGILIWFDLLGHTLVRTMRLVSLLTVNFLFWLNRFLIVMDILTHEHLTCKNIINECYRRLTRNHRLHLILELLSGKQIRFGWIAEWSLSECVASVSLGWLCCQTGCLFVLTFHSLLERIIIVARFKSFFMLSILLSEDLLLHLLDCLYWA